jgi:hypothetical protein
MKNSLKAQYFSYRGKFSPSQSPPVTEILANGIEQKKVYRTNKFSKAPGLTPNKRNVIASEPQVRVAISESQES